MIAEPLKPRPQRANALDANAFERERVPRPDADDDDDAEEDDDDEEDDGARGDIGTRGP